MHLVAKMESTAPVCEHQTPLEITEASVNIRLNIKH